MRILVIHDRDDVRKKILTLCADFTTGQDIVEARDYVEATNALRAQLFDFAIIDLTLPHTRGRGTPSFETAQNLLYEMFDSDHINSPGDVVGITRDSSALEMLAKEIGSHLMAVVVESHDGVWLKQLSDRLKYSNKSAAARRRCYRAHFDYSVCIVTALDKEAAPYEQLFELSPSVLMPNTRSFLFKDRDSIHRRGVVYSVGRAGIARSAVKVQELLDSYRPQVLVMSGFCGGVETKLELGDIALFETVFDWDCGKWKCADNGDASFVARPEPLSLRETPLHPVLRSLVEDGLPNMPNILARARELSPAFKGNAQIRLVTAASGSAVVADERVIAQIGGLNESISAVDMESYGVYLAGSASYLRRPSMVCVKAVADFCDGNKHDGLHAACSYLSATSVHHLLTRKIQFD